MHILIQKDLDTFKVVGEWKFDGMVELVSYLRARTLMHHGMLDEQYYNGNDEDWKLFGKIVRSSAKELIALNCHVTGKGKEYSILQEVG